MAPPLRIARSQDDQIVPESSFSLHLSDLEVAEQFVIWVLRNWMASGESWPQLWAGMTAFLGSGDSPEALRALDEMLLGLRRCGRRPINIGPTSHPITAQELSLLCLLEAYQRDDLPYAEEIGKWLVRPDAQSAFGASSNALAAILIAHGLDLPRRHRNAARPI